MTKLNVEIIRQGKPALSVAGGYVLHQCGGGALISVEMKSKRCQDDGYPSDFSDPQIPQIRIVATSESMRLLDERHGDTIIGFPDFAGWTVWLSHLSKYALRVCLRKETVRT